MSAGSTIGSTLGANLGPIGAGLGSVLGGLLGGDGGMDEAARQELLKQIADLQGISVPDLQKMLEVGQVGDSNFSRIDALDPQIGVAQHNALQQLQQVANGGLRVEDKVAQREAMDAASQQERGNRLAILQSMASRGMAGGGNELAAQLANQQASADRMSRAGGQAASDASKRALQALSSAGSLAGQMYGQRAQAAAAQDAVDRFNAQARTGAYQGYFNNQMDRARAIGGARAGLSGQYQDAAQRNRDAYSGIGQAVGGAAGAAYDYYNNNRPKKQPGDAIAVGAADNGETAA